MENKQETARRQAQQREVKRIQKELIVNKNTLKFKLQFATIKEIVKVREQYIKIVEELTRLNINERK
jgi:hypothetical protein